MKENRWRLIAILTLVMLLVMGAATVTLESLDQRVQTLEGLHGITTTTIGTATTSSTTTTTTTSVPPTSTSQPDPSGGPVTVLGFSQTAQWCQHTTFDCVTASGADVREWAGWTSRVSGLTNYGAIDGPIVFTISMSGHLGYSKISDAIDQIQSHAPNHTVLYLQPVIGGPAHVPQCGVRAEDRHADSWQPIVDIAAAEAGVEAVAHPHVRDCGDYRDGVGHLANTGIAQLVGAEAEAAYE